MGSRLQANGASACVVVLIVCLGSLGCKSKPQELPPDRVEITLDPESQRLSIVARDVPRMSVLSVLQAETGIEVRPIGTSNESITVEVKNAPITEAVEQLLPVGARYILWPGGSDIVIEPEVAGRKVSPPDDRRGLPTKGTVRRPPRPHLGHPKPPPNRWRPPRVQARGNVKPDPRRSMRVPPGKLPKLGKKTRADGNAVRFSFRVRSNGALVVLWAHIAEGTVPDQPVVRGPFIYVLRDSAGEAVAFGSVFDPFATRSYTDKSERHDTGSSDEGVFGVWVPVTLNASGELDSASIDLLRSSSFELYDGRGKPLPRYMTQKELGPTLRRVRLMAKVSGRVLLAKVESAQAPSAQEDVTVLHHSGKDADELKLKLNLVILGDGFTEPEQETYNEIVQSKVMEGSALDPGVFNETKGGVYREIMNAFNIFRVNKNSLESGITKVDAADHVIDGVETFFDYRYSDAWNHCFWAGGPRTNDAFTDTLNALVPDWDYALVILNVDGSRACARGSQAVMAKNRPASTAAHELGHLVGHLGDEYPGMGDYACDDPSEFNLTNDTNRDSLKWGEFVHPGNQLPPSGSSKPSGGYVGAFEGGVALCDNVRRGSGLYRPTPTCRMNSNASEFCSVCYDQMQTTTDALRDHGFSKTYVGQFDESDGGDVVVHSGNSLALYSGSPDKLNVTWVRNLPDPEWGHYQDNDEFHVGDFNGDGIDDLFVFNSSGEIPYFGMLQGTGAGFEGVRKFDGVLPGWGQMRAGDQPYVADFDGDGKDDIVVLNTADWAVGYLLMLRSTGQDLEFIERYDLDLPGWFAMRENDRLYVADFDADGKDDI